MESGRQAGLVIASHALAHVDDLNELMTSIEAVLAPGGLIAVEFHHALELARGQFDVLSHAHRSYFSCIRWSLRATRAHGGRRGYKPAMQRYRQSHRTSCRLDDADCAVRLLAAIGRAGTRR